MNFVQQLKLENRKLIDIVDHAKEICESNVVECDKALRSSRLTESERSGMLGRKNAFSEMQSLLNIK